MDSGNAGHGDHLPRAGDQIDARGSQGLVNRPTGPVNQQFVERQYVVERPHELTPEELAAAKARLAALPLDTIPDPVPLPTPHRMPLSPNPLFVGREHDLRVLAKQLKTATTTAIVAVTGLGGIGKTQLVSE